MEITDNDDNYRRNRLLSLDVLLSLGLYSDRTALAFATTLCHIISLFISVGIFCIILYS